jgi:hypothetical protein
MQGKTAYIVRPAIDRAIATHLSTGTGVYVLEGPGGAGKSAALLHGLGKERERRGKGGRGHVRILQLWGDEPPSLFAQRLLREVGILNLVAYPQPEQLARLAAEMAESIPGLSHAVKILEHILPDDMRPLPLVALKALTAAGERSMAEGDPLVIGVDLLGGIVSAPVRDFFSRLCELLPPTVVMLFAQPGGHDHLISVPPPQRISVGPFTPAEARAFLEERLGPLDADSIALLSEAQLSLLPGDLSQIVNFYTYFGKGQRLRDVLPSLSRDIAARYQALFEAQLERPDEEGAPAESAAALELVALCAVTARPQAPLSLERALSRMEKSGPLRPSELSQLRQAPLVRALCTSPRERNGGWPLLPANAQARDGIRAALDRHGLLDVYEARWLDELIETLRGGAAHGEHLAAGITALSVLLERAPAKPAALGQAVELLAEMETLLWRAGWHRAFAELYDAILPHLYQAGVEPRDVAPRLWFRRARTRVQGLDWSPSADFSTEELVQAHRELSALEHLTEHELVKARVQIGLSTDGKELLSWCRHLPHKARQARGYASVLSFLAAEQAAPPDAQAAALDDILQALSHFVAAQRAEDTAQTLTILGDFYSARREADADRRALFHYEQGLLVAEHINPPPAFCLGMIHRSIGNHHQRRGRDEQAARAYAQARRHLLRAPDARMGTLLASLLP